MNYTHVFSLPLFRSPFSLSFPLKHCLSLFLLLVLPPFITLLLSFSPLPPLSLRSPSLSLASLSFSPPFLRLCIYVFHSCEFFDHHHTSAPPTRPFWPVLKKDIIMHRIGLLALFIEATGEVREREEERTGESGRREERERDCVCVLVCVWVGTCSLKSHFTLFLDM